MSVNLAQADGAEGIDGGAIEPPPQPCKPNDASSAKAVAAPSFNSSRRVKFCIGLEVLDALLVPRVWPLLVLVSGLMEMQLIYLIVNPWPTGGN